MRRLVVFIVVFAVVFGAAASWWVNHGLAMNAPVIDLSVEPGMSPRGVAQAVAQAGVEVNPLLLYWWFRLSGQARQIKAGSYEIQNGSSPRDLLQKLVRGEQALRAVTLVEGWTFNQFRAALSKADHLKPETVGLSPESIMSALGLPRVHPEGRFFPDTYTYVKGSSDLDVMGRAMRAMDREVALAWSQRQSDTPLKSPEQVLILASIVEKETGRASERALIAAVFSNRLRIGMLLQTDPTVIYGMGDAFDGNLRRRDLQTDTPWNTYTRPGLPLTPIAMPGKASLLASVQPAPTKAVYFVSRGDGSSYFSDNLEEHNRAVDKYQRGR